MNKFLILISAFILPGVFVACSDTASMVSAPRSADFYQNFVNDSDDFLVAKTKMSELKMLEVGDEYPMRFVLFQDGRFYYQIDKLGDGTGWWKHDQGALQLTAVRPIFDMNLYVSAASPTSDETLIRFMDRHGFNSIGIRLRDPAALPKNTTQDANLISNSTGELRTFTSHPDGI